MRYHTFVARILTKNGNPISGVTVSAVDENTPATSCLANIPARK
jgi:hypothetical protein